MLTLAQMQTDAIGEEDGELEEDLSPVLYPVRPLTDDIHRCQHFGQGFIRWKNALALCDFTEMAVVALNHVDRVDGLTDIRRLLEKGRDLR
jgi:hypothetical protein